MVCNKCNAQVPDGVQFCPNCGNNINFTSTGNVGVGQIVNNNVNHSSTNNQDKVNVWLVILSWFIPLAGLVIFFVKKETSPKTAKISGICALVSFILNLIIVVLTFVMFFGLVNANYNLVVEKTESLIDDIYEDTQDQIGDMSDIEDTTVADEGTDITATNIDISSDWKQYQVGINGKVVTLPMPYTELATATGFNLKDSHSNLVLQNGYYILVNMYKNDKLALYIEVYNNSGAEAKYVDSNVTRISQTKYQVSQGAEAIVFPGGIKVGDSITDAQIISLFGTPNDLNDYGSSKQYTYLSDTTWTTTNNFKIKIVDGIIDEIQLDHRN